MKAHPRTTYRHAAPQTWHLIRGAYLSGASAPAVAARFGVSVSAIRKRAAREGWTKRAYALATGDLPPPPEPGQAFLAAGTPPPAEPDAAKALAQKLWPLPEVSARVVSRKALALSLQALEAGRGLEARRLAAAAREIVDLDEHLPWAEPQEDPDAFERRQATMTLFIREMALELAMKLHAGEPLPDHYADLADQLQRQREAAR